MRTVVQRYMVEKEAKNDASIQYVRKTLNLKVDKVLEMLYKVSTNQTKQ